MTASESDVFELDSRYSTTRRVSKQAPQLGNNPQKKISSQIRLPASKNRQCEGGLRLQGYYKCADLKHPLITVITVVFNAENYLEKTIQSIIEHNYPYIEFIVLDGGSTDSTLDIIKKYDAQIDYWASEPDKGIYDAMNKALKLATGDWFIHINAGDELVQNSLNLMADKLESGKTFVYGNTFVCTAEKEGYVFGNAYKKPEEIISKSCFYHQAVIYNMHYADYYDISYQYIADRIMSYETLQRTEDSSAQYVDILIATYLDGGFSSRDSKNIIKEEYNYFKKSKLLTPELYFRYILKYLKANIMDALVAVSLYDYTRRIWRYLTSKEIKRL